MMHRAASAAPPEPPSDGPPAKTVAAAARWRALVGLLFLAAYVLPLYAPPGPQLLLPPTPDASLLERLFPTVPGWWVVVRLGCLLVGAVLIAGAVDAPAAVHLLRVRARRLPEPSRHIVLATLCVAATQSLLSLGVGHFTRPLQLGYLALLALPTALLWVNARWRGAQQSGGPPRRRAHRYTALVVVLILALWCVWRIPAALHSPRAATPIDLWLNFQWMIEVVSKNDNLLTSSSQAGVPNTYMVFMGAPLFGPSLMPSLAWVQGLHVVWILATAAALAQLTALTAGRAAAVLAVSTFLFSPLIFMVHLAPAPFGVLTLLAAALLLLTRQVYVNASVMTLAAFGAVAGISATLPHLTHLALAASTVVVVRALRKPRLPGLGLLIAAATFVAATVPSLPSFTTINAMLSEYVQHSWQWAGAEAVLFGQRSPRRPPDMAALMFAGRSAPYDVVLGALLMPFAAPRTAMRLCGDALIAPIGAALAAVGLVVCARRPTKRGAAALLAVYGLALLPAVFTTQFDRISLTRSIGMPVVVALLAGVGFQTLRRALVDRRHSTQFCAATVVASMLAGAVLFEVVLPRLIAASSLDIVMQAGRNLADPSRVILLDQLEPYPPPGWLHVSDIAKYLPAEPFATWKFETRDSVLPPPTEPTPELLFWSPGVEEDARASQAICARWPDAGLYILNDRAGLSRAFAASPRGTDWRPALPAAQWEVGNCEKLAGRLHGRY